MFPMLAMDFNMEWSEEEQRTLEILMVQLPQERMDPLQRYVKMAAALPRKTVRDVAMRTRWTQQQQQQQMKKRKPGESMLPVIPGSKRPTGIPAALPPKPPGMAGGPMVRVQAF
jgi:hypothetical protein